MPRRVAKDPNAFPWQQLLVLGICRFSEPLAFNSVLAYSFAFTVDLGIDRMEASFYSGLLISAYAVAEALTAMGWGSLSDRYGRKPIVLIGLGGVVVSCLIIGFAQNFWIALLARFIGGALNGNVAVMQTMVAEMVKKPEHEPLAYATQPFVWTLGGIIGSALGGFLAKPAVYHPHIFPADGIFGRYPYLLPNLVCVVGISMAIVQGIFFLEETNPRARRDAAAAAADTAVLFDDDVFEDDETTPLRPERRKPSNTSRLSSVSEQPRMFFLEESLALPTGVGFDIRRGSFGTMHSIEISHKGGHPGPLHPDLPPIGSDIDEYDGPVWNRTVVMLIVALVLLSYHQMASATLLPIHLVDTPKAPVGHLDLQGGFGYELPDVSVYLSVNGIISLFIQAFVFPAFVAKVGVWHSFVIIVLLYPSAYLLMPFLSALPGFTSAGVYVSLIMQSFYGIIVNPVALILLKDAVPSTLLLGRVNGLAMSACCFARTLSPPLVGLIYGLGGSGAAWFSCAAITVIGILQLMWVPRTSNPQVAIETAIESAIEEIHRNDDE